MARSGNITITQGAQNVAANTSPITVIGKITTTNGSYRGSHRGGVATVKQGSKTIYSEPFTSGADADTTTTLFTIELVVEHDAEGKSDVITASYDYDDGWCTATAYLELDPIPRASTLALENGTLGTALTWAISENAASFTHKIKYTCGKLSGYILGNVGAAYSTLTGSWTPPLEWAAQYPNDKSVKATIELETYSNGVRIGSNPYTRTFAIPASVKPTLSLAISDENGYAGIYGGYIKGRSKIKVALTATGVQGSTIKAYKTTVDGKTFTTASFTTDYVTGKGTLTISATVTDSRDRSTTVTDEITVLDYVAPALSEVSVSRSDASGKTKPLGAYLRVKFNAKVASLNNRNSATYKVSYKKASASIYTNTVTLTEYADVYQVSEGVYVFAAETDVRYDIILSVEDDFERVPVNKVGPTVSVFISRFARGMGIAFGKIAELINTFDVGWPAIFRQDATTYDSEGTGHVIGETLKSILARFTNYLPRSGGSANPMTGSVYFRNNVNIWADDADGTPHDVFEPKNSDGNTVIGWSNYDKKSGDTMVFGHDAWIGVSNIASPNRYRPYYRQGEGYSIGVIATAGFVTNGGKDVYFILPVTKYIVGSPAISVTSVDGFILRQGGNYTHGSGSTTWVKPDSYEEVLLPSSCIRIKATFQNTANVINNDVIGIWWSGRMDFS